MKQDSLGDRMKANYENISKTKLVRRMPVIIRIDGKAFHTYTRKFEKPFDVNMIQAMQMTMKSLCENIQGCVFGYTQSDEISLLLIDYQNLESAAWFDYKVQKICSVAASMATVYFNQEIQKLLPELDKWAMFDARCFNVPREEVTNYFYWRQLDAMRNSVEAVGHAYFSQKQLHKKSCAQILEMLKFEKDIDFELMFSLVEKRGSCCYKQGREFIIDNIIPIFKGVNRDYVEQYLYLDVENEKENTK